MVRFYLLRFVFTLLLTKSPQCLPSIFANTTMQALYACSSNTNFFAQRSFLRITSSMRLICQQFSNSCCLRLLYFRSYECCYVLVTTFSFFYYFVFYFVCGDYCIETIRRPPCSKKCCSSSLNACTYIRV